MILFSPNKAKDSRLLNCQIQSPHLLVSLLLPICVSSSSRPFLEQSRVNKVVPSGKPWCDALSQRLLRMDPDPVRSVQYKTGRIMARLEEC